MQLTCDKESRMHPEPANPKHMVKPSNANLRAHSSLGHMYVRTYVCMHVCRYVCMHVCVVMCVYHIYIYTYMYVKTCMYLCVCVFVFI